MENKGNYTVEDQKKKKNEILKQQKCNLYDGMEKKKKETERVDQKIFKAEKRAFSFYLEKQPICA